MPRLNHPRHPFLFFSVVDQFYWQFRFWEGFGQGDEVLLVGGDHWSGGSGRVEVVVVRFELLWGGVVGGWGWLGELVCWDGCRVLVCGNVDIWISVGLYRPHHHYLSTPILLPILLITREPLIIKPRVIHHEPLPITIFPTHFPSHFLPPTTPSRLWTFG